MTKEKNTTIPDGYLRDARGRLVPVEIIDEIDLERDRLVREIVAEGERLAAALADFKARAHADIAAFIELSAERYNVKLGGEKGNVSLTTYDGRFRILRAVQAGIGFDERLMVAKQLVNNCRERWAQSSNPHLVLLASEAFEPDSNGNVSTSKVLGLRRHKIDDPEWQEAMRAIADSIQALDSKSYIRMYERKTLESKYELMPLNVAGV